jgi:DDE family transposase
MLSSESIGDFGDKRLARRGSIVFNRIVSTGSLVQRRVGENRAGELGMARFLASPSVTKEEIVETIAKRTARSCLGRRVVVAQDTTEVNFAGREAGRWDLGPAGDGKSAGFLIHAAVAVDVESAAVLGLADATIWRRAGTVEVSRQQRELSAKESHRWLTTTRIAADLLKDAEQVIVVGDRENDIYSVMARRPAHTDLIVRAARDRVLEDGGKLFEEAASWRVLKTTDVELEARRPGEKRRTARLEVRGGVVRLRRPKTADACDPAELELTLVEAREVGAPKGVTAVHWRLLSSLPADTTEQAEEIIQLYRLRWRIEQVFRALKSDGLKLPEVQMQNGTKLLKLASLGLAAAVRILQLVDARDGSERPASDIADEPMIEAALAIGPTLEGKTARQHNPHPPRSLGWLAWIVARLGGWNCYYKPPGPKTMGIGWHDFTQHAAGFLLARQNVRIP